MKLKNLARNYGKSNLQTIINTLIFCLIFILDRVTKYLALSNEFRYFNTKYLSFDLMINRGISWSILDFESQNSFYIVSSFVLLILLILAFQIKSKIKKNQVIVGELLILSGGISNFIDRLLYNGVIDFIIFSYGDWSWPAFNLADVSIVIGVIFLLFEIF